MSTRKKRHLRMVCVAAAVVGLLGTVAVAAVIHQELAPGIENMVSISDQQKEELETGGMLAEQEAQAEVRGIKVTALQSLEDYQTVMVACRIEGIECPEEWDGEPTDYPLFEEVHLYQDGEPMDISIQKQFLRHVTESEDGNTGYYFLEDGAIDFCIYFSKNSAALFSMQNEFIASASHIRRLLGFHMFQGEEICRQLRNRSETAVCRQDVLSYYALCGECFSSFPDFVANKSKENSYKDFGRWRTSPCEMGFNYRQWNFLYFF